MVSSVIPSPCGILVLDKPRGPTSHDVVARVRRALRTREVGHAGTLNPMATGVLVVAVGEATKLVPYLTGASKAYEASIALGSATDTLDAEGRETARVPVPEDVLEALAASDASSPHSRLRAALDAEVARTSQVPPAFSAIHSGGERAHEKARRGEEVVLEPRPVRVEGLAILHTAVDARRVELTVALTVSKGYYVRSLARDLAEGLGTVGHLVALRRTRSGCFAIDEALPDDLGEGELAARVIPIEHAARRALPSIDLTATGARDARHGRLIDPSEMTEAGLGGASGPRALFDPDGALVAIGELREDHRAQVVRGFRLP